MPATETSQIAIGEIMRYIAHAEQRATLLGIGPVSQLVIRAAFDAAAEEGFPPLFIASRNQVDCRELGGGYLLGSMDAAGLMRLLREQADAAGYTGPWFVCRDHGGPWQRNEELSGKLPVAEALQRARQSFRADIAAGFHYLHIDPTKCPLPHSESDLITWTAELIAYCEEVRRELGGQPIAYEIGAEDIQGGDTAAEKFECFIANALRQLRACNLPVPVCAVGQTGTLTKLDRNEGGFHAATARLLVGVARKYGLGFKEHNADYLADDALLLHPEIGITAANVAPEFALVETAALLEYAESENAAVAHGRLGVGRASGLMERLSRAVRKSAPWRKWLPGSLKNAPEEDLFGDARLARRLTEVCGHYVFHLPEIQAARHRLMANIAALWGVHDPEQRIRRRVADAIRRYVRAFRLTGLNALLGG